MKKTISLLILVSTCLVGCASIDKLGAKLDMADQRLGSKAKPVYTGTLSSAQKIGAMTALQFSDGRFFDVASVPQGLAPGDTVRLFQTEEGYVAHIWRVAPEDIPSAETNTLAPAVPSK